jgi:hypothetical protein
VIRPARRRCLCSARVRGDQKATEVSRRALGFVGTGAQQTARDQSQTAAARLGPAAPGRECVPRAPYMVWRAVRSRCGPAAESQPIPDHRSCLAYSAKRVVSAPLGCTHAINSARGWGDASRRMQCKRERRRCDGTATAPREATHPHAPIASAPPREGTRNLAT